MSVILSLRSIIHGNLEKFAAKAHSTFHGEYVTRVKHVNPTGPRGRWGIDVTMTDNLGEERHLAVSVVEVPDGGLPDPIQALAKVISGSMELESDPNSPRCRDALHIVTGFADAMASHPDFDRAALNKACQPSWMSE